jgi:hypothetical protein
MDIIATIFFSRKAGTAAQLILIETNAVRDAVRNKSQQPDLDGH